MTVFKKSYILDLPSTTDDYKWWQGYLHIIFMLAGLILSILSAVGMSFFYKSGYIQHQGEYPPGWYGYDVKTFVGLTFFLAFSSSGLTLLYVGTLNLIRRLTQPFRSGAFIVIASLCVIAGCCGIFWGNESMKCMVVFCVGVDKYVEVKYARPEAGVGFLSLIGMSAFFTFVPIGLVLSCVGFGGLFTRGSSTLAARMSCWKAYCKHPSVRGIAYSIPFILLFWCAVFSFYVPNSWRYFVASRIASFATHEISADAAVCNAGDGKVSCAELPNAWMRTANWRWSPNLNLKLFPGNLCYYIYLLLALAMATLLNVPRSSRLWMKKPIGALWMMTYGELGFAFLSVCMLVVFFIYWVHDHNFVGYWTGGTDPNIFSSERWARALGQLAVVFFSLCIFSASRYTFMHSMMGTSWESSIWVHKVLGYGMLGATVGHMVSWYVFYGQKGNFPHDVFAIPMRTDISADNFTVPLTSLATWFMLLAVGVFSLWPVRRRFFELFYYLHVVSFYIITPAVLWHAAAAWEYLLPSLTVWFLDRLTRLSRSANTVQVKSVVSFGNVVRYEFAFETPAAPGAYAFVNIPEISLLEWHPFSFCVTEDGENAFYMRSMGKGTWTGKALEQGGAPEDSLTMCVDGPYGGLTNIDDYEMIILIAGGIGITPCASIFSHLTTMANPPFVKLIWAVREEHLLEQMSFLWGGEDVDSSMPTMEADTDVSVFFTGECTEESEVQKHSLVRFSRPDLFEEILSACQEVTRDRVLVFACGPPALVKNAGNSALAAGTRFHAETFEL